METFLAITSRREVREYRADPIPDEVVRAILEAGRVSGSGRNTQPWRFFVVESGELLAALTPTVSRPSNIAGAPLLIAIAVRRLPRGVFDGGRAAQSMMLAGWDAGVGSCPNGFTDALRAAELLGVDADHDLLIGLTFGYPVRPRPPESRTPEAWLSAADRLPLDEITRFRT